MPRIDVLRETNVERTARVMQMEGMFDVPPSQKNAEHWDLDFDLPNDWNVGLIVGPSGSGKTTIAREVFGEYVVSGWDWPENKSILDGFPKDMSIKDIVNLLSSVGFSSPPSWVRPFKVLSNGEQFRVNMARTLAENKDIAVVDEFTSVVDRTVAQIGSAAIQKTIRKRNQKFIAVSCHYDIIDWLEPDWVFQPHTGELLVGRCLWRRPKIELKVKRVHSSAWQLFRKHHYLSTTLNPSAVCFCAFWNEIPVAFIAWLPIPHKIKNLKRITRIVTLPDYQGVGIGRALQTYMSAIVKGMGFKASITSSHPAVINSLNNDKNWLMTQSPRRTSDGGKLHRKMGLSKTHSTKRLVASFQYVGEALSKEESYRVWNS